MEKHRRLHFGRGMYKILMMSFGLTNAPTAFMDLMNRVLRPFLDRFAIVFIDDILVYSRSATRSVSRFLSLIIRALCVWALNCVCQMWMIWGKRS